MLWESSSSGKVATIKGEMFWKSYCSKKVALQEKEVIGNISFLKN